VAAAEHRSLRRQARLPTRRWPRSILHGPRLPPVREQLLAQLCAVGFGFADILLRVVQLRPPATPTAVLPVQSWPSAACPSSVGDLSRQFKILAFSFFALSVAVSRIRIDFAIRDRSRVYCVGLVLCLPDLQAERCGLRTLRVVRLKIRAVRLSEQSLEISPHRSPSSRAPPMRRSLNCLSAALASFAASHDVSCFLRASSPALHSRRVSSCRPWAVASTSAGLCTRFQCRRSRSAVTSARDVLTVSATSYWRRELTSGAPVSSVRALPQLSFDLCGIWGSQIVFGVGLQQPHAVNSYSLSASARRPQRLVVRHL
jgi:hypothetical protein